jgi:UDP-glucose 4-epimerase
LPAANSKVVVVGPIFETPGHMKILVTGGAGFIGSHLSDALLHLGHEVHILDNLSSGSLNNVPQNAVFHEMDIRDAAVEKLFEAQRFEVMFHQAAQMDVRRSVADPMYDASINVMGLLNLMEAGRKHGLKKVIFASSGGAIYGDPVYVPQDEKHPLQPASPYGITKLIGEHYLHFYQQVHGISFVALRYANVYGPRQNPHGEAGVVAIFTERMLKGQPCFINGTGKQTRDYVYVKDVVSANVLALKMEKSGVFNVGTGLETDVITLFRYIRQYTGSTIREAYAPAKPGEQMRSVVGTAAITEALGWRCQYDLKIGLQETVGWFRKQVAGG